MFKPELTTLEACHRLVLSEGQKREQTGGKMEKWFKVVLIVLVVATVIWAMTFDWSMQEYYNYVCAWEKINYDRMIGELFKLNVTLWLLCGWIYLGVSFHRYRQKNMKGK